MKRFGWTWLNGMARDTEFLRGSDSAGNQMAAGKKAIGLGGWVTPDAGSDSDAETVGMIPRLDDPFVAWGQREAIMRDARHPIDFASRRLAGWAIAGHMRTDLVTEALAAAERTRGSLAGAIMHSSSGEASPAAQQGTTRCAQS